MSDVSLQLTTLSPQGLDIELKEKVLTHLYGLSDFWATTFSDVDVVNTLLESTSYLASDIYNEFIQISSGISIEEVQSQLNYQSKLIFISESDLIVGEVETYKLSENITFSNFIVDQPLLPKACLETEVDFRIDPEAKTISFAKPISQYGFIFKMANGIRTYAFWLVDARLDNEVLISEYASKLGIDRPNYISELFKQFLYGMYYLYTQGPTLSVIKRGLNLVIGIPIAKENEVVLDIRQYDETEDYYIITDLNSYKIPSGINPIVQIGDSLVQGQELATWVDLKDYVNDGEWWLNLAIPAQILPHVPIGQDRYARQGGYAYSLMSSYLKNHTFLVRITTANFKNVQTYAQISDILNTLKPAHTYPIYIWTAPFAESFNLTEVFSMNKGVHFAEEMGNTYWRFRRNSSQPILRSEPGFIRFSAPGLVDDLLGNSPGLNGSSTTSAEGVTISGYINQFSVMRPNSDYDQNWVKTIYTRGTSYFRPKRSMVFRNNDLPSSLTDAGFDYLKSLYPARRTLRLYCDNKAAVLSKYSSLGLTEAQLGSFITELHGATDFLKSNFPSLLIPSTNRRLGPAYPVDSYNVFCPDITSLNPSDFLVFVNLQLYDIIAVYWVTDNQVINAPSYIPNYGIGRFSTKIFGTRNRKLARLGQPVYMNRISSNYVDAENNAPLTRGTPSNFTFTRIWK